MKILTTLVGIVLLVFGVCLIPYGIYYAIVHMLVGGIVDIINQIKAETTSAPVVAWGIAKILLANATAVVSIWAGFIIAAFGAALCSGDECHGQYQIRRHRR